MPALFKLKDHFKENKLYLNRTVTAISTVLILLCVLICRLVFLQIYQYDLYVTLARNNQVRVIPIAPTRGLIYDRNGIVLAENMPTFSLEIIPHRSKNLQKTLSKLSKIINITEEEIRIFKKHLKYKGYYENIPICTKLTDEEVARISVEKYNFPEIEIAAILSRHYPQGEIFAHALGYIGPISEEDLKKIDISKYRGIYQIGKAGIEQSYEEILRGKAGFEQVETDARGRIIRTLDVISPVAGKNIYLSIDSNLQNIAYNALAQNNGSIIALDNKTGKILAFVNKPSYDPNLFIQGIDKKTYAELQKSPIQPLFNRAIKGQYPPGSTIKPIIAMQALEHGIINQNEHIYDPGYYQQKADGRIFRELKAKHGHGFINIENAIAVSCTTFFYYLADKLGVERIYDIYNKFGLGQPTNIDIYGEAIGIAPSPRWKRQVMHTAWFPGETLNIGIGQGYTLVTPLQVVQMAATIANKGILMQPSLVQSIQSATDIPEVLSPIVKNVIKLNNEKNWNIITRGMEQTVSNPIGTAHRIYKPSWFKIAGKTGTAQVFSRKDDNDNNYDRVKNQAHLRDHAWFMAFAPIEEPKIAVVVLMEHGGGGSSPVARIIIDEYLKDYKHE
jgi:penicillin-binding protein 2